MNSDDALLATLVKSLTALPEAHDRVELQQVFWQQVAACQRKNRNEEGIPMCLVLEDVSDVPLEQLGADAAPDNSLNAMLVTASEFFRQQLQTQEEDLSSKDISTILEVLADYCLVLQPQFGVPGDKK